MNRPTWQRISSLIQFINAILHSAVTQKNLLNRKFHSIVENVMLCLYLNIKPWRSMGELTHSSRSKMAVSNFTIWPFYHRGKSPRYPLGWRLIGSQGQSGLGGKIWKSELKQSYPVALLLLHVSVVTPYLFACRLVAPWYSNLNSDEQFVGKWNTNQNLGQINRYAI